MKCIIISIISTFLSILSYAGIIEINNIIGGLLFNLISISFFIHFMDRKYLKIL